MLAFFIQKGLQRKVIYFSKTYYNIFFKCTEFIALTNMSKFEISCSKETSRDGKSLQNSTRKTLSLKNYHTKYMQKMLKIAQKRLKTFTKTHEKNKN